MGKIIEYWEDEWKTLVPEAEHSKSQPSEKNTEKEVDDEEEEEKEGEGYGA
jgi:hypothetical protein